MPTEKVEVVLVRQAREVEAKIRRLMQQEILSRVGLCCGLTQGMGGSGTYAWMAGFEDISVQWGITI